MLTQFVEQRIVGQRKEKRRQGAALFYSSINPNRELAELLKLRGHRGLMEKATNCVHYPNGHVDFFKECKKVPMVYRIKGFGSIKEQNIFLLSTSVVFLVQVNDVVRAISARDKSLLGLV